MTERYMVEIREAKAGDRALLWRPRGNPAKLECIVDAVGQGLAGYVGPVIVENGERTEAADLQPLIIHGPGRITDTRYRVTNLAFKPGDDDVYVVATDTFATPTDAGWRPSFSFKVPVDAAPAIGEVVLLSWGQP